LQINQGYIVGEWQAKITDTKATIWKPDGTAWATGKVQTFQNQLWLQTDTKLFKGIYALDNLPEVGVLTWGLGENEAPLDFDTAMRGDDVFVLVKCLNAATCKFNIKELLARVNLIQQQKRLVQQNDPCMKYGDCQTCVDARFYCGWCSVNVVYNGSIPGRNCAGVNKSVTGGLTFNCTGSFSINDCTQTTTGASTAASSAGTSGEGTGSGTGTGTGSSSTASTASSTTGTPDLYTCNSKDQKCYKTPTGQPSDVCTAQCQMTPIVPPILQNKYFRGLSIELNYLKGEWIAAFSNSSVTVTSPTGQQMTGKVGSTAQFLSVHWADGTVIQTIWQSQGGPATDFFTWAWGKVNGVAPASFDEAMVTDGQQEFFFVSCPVGKAENICQWK
jgi:hypothetical protein